MFKKLTVLLIINTLSKVNYFKQQHTEDNMRLFNSAFIFIKCNKKNKVNVPLYKWQTYSNKYTHSA